MYLKRIWFSNSARRSGFSSIDWRNTDDNLEDKKRLWQMRIKVQEFARRKTWQTITWDTIAQWKQYRKPKQEHSGQGGHGISNITEDDMPFGDGQGFDSFQVAHAPPMAPPMLHLWPKPLRMLWSIADSCSGCQRGQGKPLCSPALNTRQTLCWSLYLVHTLQTQTHVMGQA